MAQRETRRSKEYDETIQNFKQQVQVLAGKVQPGDFIDFCEEMEFFFMEAGEGAREILEQRELGLIK